ncbi:phage protease [Prosthecobacter sp.]|uniref:phage protease n=1 Tax=Prosthecobacter sp. TaxID=1965333 RepID=UPI0037C680C6
MSKLTLHTFRVSATPLYAGGEAPPSRLVVLPWGVNKSRRGDFIVDALTAQVFAENQNRNRIDGKVALDFEHNTLPGTPAYESSSEPRPIAAWALCSVIEGEGIVYEDIEWTPDGLSAWERKLYQDLSPAPVRGKDGKTVIALHSTALCRHGELEGLTIDHAAAPKALAAYFDALSADITLPTSTPLTPPMKLKLIALLAALGVTLDPNADEATTSAALDSAMGKLKKEETPAGEAEGMSAEMKGFRTEIAQGKKELEQGRKDLLITKATQEGKVIPLSAAGIEATPLSALTELVGNLKPGAVPLKKKTVDGQEITEDAGQPEALSADEIKIMRNCGLSEAEIEAEKAKSKPTATAA